MVSSVHIVTLVSQFWPRQAVELFSLAHRAVATPLKDHRPHPLHVRINVFAGLKQVRINEVALYTCCGLYYIKYGLVDHNVIESVNKLQIFFFTSVYQHPK